ncbi:hypothetical protein [Nonomuraea sp. NPDC050643]|uniref:hypothetical protein n=1 Tax=Nonomuraea sp. NPDC050643 TaxID=3155660 RepID=UPI0033DDF926
MRLVKEFAVTAAVAAALVVPAALAPPAMAAENGRVSVAGSSANDSAHVMGGRVGPFRTWQECQRSRREWDIDYGVSLCYHSGPYPDMFWFDWY